MSMVDNCSELFYCSTPENINSKNSVATITSSKPLYSPASIEPSEHLISLSTIDESLCGCSTGQRRSLSLTFVTPDSARLNISSKSCQQDLLLMSSFESTREQDRQRDFMATCPHHRNLSCPSKSKTEELACWPYCGCNSSYCSFWNFDPCIALGERILGISLPTKQWEEIAIGVALCLDSILRKICVPMVTIICDGNSVDVEKDESTLTQFATLSDISLAFSDLDYIRLSDVCNGDGDGRPTQRRSSMKRRQSRRSSVLNLLRRKSCTTCAKPSSVRVSTETGQAMLIYERNDRGMELKSDVNCDTQQDSSNDHNSNQTAFRDNGDCQNSSTFMDLENDVYSILKQLIVQVDLQVLIHETAERIIQSNRIESETQKLQSDKQSDFESKIESRLDNIETQLSHLKTSLDRYVNGLLCRLSKVNLNAPSAQITCEKTVFTTPVRSDTHRNVNQRLASMSSVHTPTPELYSRVRPNSQMINVEQSDWDNAQMTIRRLYAENERLNKTNQRNPPASHKRK